MNCATGERKRSTRLPTLLWPRGRNSEDDERLTARLCAGEEHGGVADLMSRHSERIRAVEVANSFRSGGAIVFAGDPEFLPVMTTGKSLRALLVV